MAICGGCDEYSLCRKLFTTIKNREMRQLEGFWLTQSNCQRLSIYDCYIPKKEDTPVELINNNDNWIVAFPKEYGRPNGFEEIRRSDCYVKEFPTLEKALQVYWEIFEKVRRKRKKE